MPVNGPRSPTLLRLILLGLVVVTLPLIYAIVSAINNVERLAVESRQALESVQENTSNVRALETRTLALERSALQYQALQDPSFLEIYQRNREEVLRLVSVLSSTNSDAPLSRSLEPLTQTESRVQEMLLSDGIDETALDRDLIVLREQMAQVIRMQNLISAELAEQLPRDVLRVKRKLIDQAVYIIPLSAMLAIVLTLLIRRPLQQLKRTIRALGRGALGEPVVVKGSRDLVELGQRLEWLRLRLRELERQKSQFLRNVSHELKTPLASIREGADLLSEGDWLEDRAEREQILHIVRDSSLRLQRMIEELLRYGAEGDLSAQEEDEAVALRPLVEEVLEPYRSSLALNDVTLETRFQALQVPGNVQRMRVIVDNLLSNAAKYVPRGGLIQLRLEAREDGVVFSVQDNGPGVSEDFRPQLFEWFKSGPAPSNALIAGSGVGLAIAQEYAMRHHGEIRLEESAVGALFVWYISQRGKDES